MKELNSFSKPEMACLVSETPHTVIEQINERIKNIDKQIQQIIEQDAQVSRKVDQITSVKGLAW
ncbi:MAG: hypothetical protein H6568_15320 [Lewinellaceae bacterium]|nr:hypothetical protein [Lewinellaceae bacterium]